MIMVMRRVLAVAVVLDRRKARPRVVGVRTLIVEMVKPRRLYCINIDNGTI